ncbi:MAG: ATP-binding protein [Candidatus Rokuibacteriota bacterium]
MGQPPPSTPGAEPESVVDAASAAQRIAASAVRLLRARLSWRLDPAATTTCVTVPADPSPSPAAAADAEIAFGDRALRERRPIGTPDVLGERHLALEPSVREAIAREGLGALAAVPIRTTGAAMGSLVLADRTGRRFTEQEMILLSTLADQMAPALENVRIQAALVRQRHETAELALGPLLGPLLGDLAGEIEARGLTVTQDLAVTEVTGERQELQEALANLLSNAVKFSSKQGGPITVRSYREGDQVVVAVADQGVGFDMQYHDRIFGIFERLHRQENYPGTGVGLAIVRKVAERHGGRGAWAESEIGKGSTFFLAVHDPR